MRRLAIAMLVVALLAGGVIAYAKLRGHEQIPRTDDGKTVVRITGHVEGLQPGKPTLLTAMARNHIDRPVRLLDVRARVSDASPECPRTLLRTVAYLPRKPLPPNGDRRVPILVTLSPDAPDVCQNAVFPLDYQTRLSVLERGKHDRD